MTFNELVCAILEVCPTASFGEDNEGQIIIYTDLCGDVNEDLKPLIL